MTSPSYCSLPWPGPHTALSRCSATAKRLLFDYFFFENLRPELRPLRPIR